MPNFDTLSETYLKTLEIKFEAALAAHNLDYDSEYNMGVLTIEVEGKTFLFNKHTPLQQIWLSSPLSGAWHFDYDEAEAMWIDTKTKQSLPTIIKSEFYNLFHIDINVFE